MLVKQQRYRTTVSGPVRPPGACVDAAAVDLGEWTHALLVGTALLLGSAGHPGAGRDAVSGPLAAGPPPAAPAGERHPWSGRALAGRRGAARGSPRRARRPVRGRRRR